MSTNLRKLLDFGDKEFLLESRKYLKSLKSKREKEKGDNVQLF